MSVRFFFVATATTDALSWLEQQGITMIAADDNSTIVNSGLQAGQTLTLTGNMALPYRNTSHFIAFASLIPLKLFKLINLNFHPLRTCVSLPQHTTSSG